jgi:rod shape-determining protein MreD
MDHSPVSRLTFGFILAAAVLTVFLQTSTEIPRCWLYAQVDLLPSLVVFASATGDFTAFIACVFIGGLSQDSFSSNPLGTSILPLLSMGAAVHRSRALIVLQDPWVQAVAGFVGSLLASILSILVIRTLGLHPIVGWISFWPMAVMAVGSAAATPFWFWLFPCLEKTFGYDKMPETSFRPDREIKRGRG